MSELTTEVSQSSSKANNQISFDQLNPPLNPLILSSLASLSLSHPTQVQRDFIPLALSGKDILAGSRTAKKRLNPIDTITSNLTAIVLVPTRELSEQVSGTFRLLCNGMGSEAVIEVLNLSAPDGPRSKRRSHKTQRLDSGSSPDVLVSTPAKLLSKLRSGSLNLSNLSFLVMDEADLILSYGHSSDDIKAILSGSGTADGITWRFPNFYQSFLMSATMTEEVAQLKNLVLRDPEVLMVKESENELKNLTQFSINISNEQDKFLLVYVIFRLRLIKGKGLIFFGIRSGVLNSELPFNSRYHAVQEFNRGVFNYLIATDESGDSHQPVDESSLLISTQPAEESKSNAEAQTTSEKSSRRGNEKTLLKTDLLTDHKTMAFPVVMCDQFDIPPSARCYTHRIGRTARAGRTGISLSFVRSNANQQVSKDLATWARIEEQQRKRGSEIREYKFDMTQVEGFRYRMEDGLRSVTKAAIREARIKEIKNEVMNSEKLKSHFEANPNDLAFLKHDKPLHPTRIQPHMKHVPSYLVPKIAPVAINQTEGDTRTICRPEPSVAKTSGVRYHKEGRKSNRGGRGGKSGRGGGRKKDPLKSFSLK
ncbi:P-loop containing nucleoside triphosphate hydrolase protein [Melampsora americana]|nr:P-loop containing nucleoside triphosphate hydrolase protein [Melampsora americana]